MMMLRRTLVILALPLAISMAPSPLAAQVSPGFVDTCAPNALACLRADLDGDGRADVAQVIASATRREYWISIRTQRDGLTEPFSGSYLPDDRISLVVREGAGDLRCRAWRPGAICGSPVSSHAPRVGLYLTHSRQGEFLIAYRRSGEVYPRSATGCRLEGWFQVVPTSAPTP